MTLRIWARLGILASLVALLTPLTLMVFGFLRRSLRPTTTGGESLVIAASALIAFVGALSIVALSAPLIAMSVAYVIHTVGVCKQDNATKAAAAIIRRAHEEKWHAERIADEAPSLALRLTETRWWLAQDYFLTARHLGESVNEAVPLCGGAVIDVEFATAPTACTIMKWTTVESKRLGCRFRKKGIRAKVIHASLAQELELEHPDLAYEQFKAEAELSVPEASAR